MTRSRLAFGSPALPPGTPTVECGVAGPRGQRGLLVRAPANETLAWDLESEIVPTCCLWWEQQHGWWVAAPYLSTVIDAVLRSFTAVVILDRERGDRLVSRDRRGVLRERRL